MPRFSVSGPLAGIVAAVVLAACASESSGPPPAGDTTPPTVLSVTPANGATGVAAGANVTVNFSEPVAPASVTAATFSVGSAAGTIVVTGSSATFTPSAPLAGGTAHAVGVAGARDTAGNAMATPFASSFTTLAEPLAANAGPDQHASFASTVTLNAAASTGSGLTYTWAQIAGPAVTLSPVGALAGFSAPSEPEALEFEVSVTDGATSDKDTVVVFVWEDRNHTYYVASGGNDGNAGTRAAPFATVQAAITAADVAGNGGDVYVAGGAYEQSLTLKARVSVYGGFVAGTWRRSLSQETAIRGGTTAVSGADAQSLTLDGLTIEAVPASAPGGSSIALLLNNSVNVRIHGNTIIAYAGARGTHGVAGTNGLSGSNGDDGLSNGLFCVPPQAGGDGGGSYVAGGDGGNGGIAGGFNGSGGGASGAAAGGGGGDGGSTFNAGDDGGNGRTGAQGADGARGAAFGAVSPAGYIPADGLSGTNGAHGSGGGGGGGGGGITVACGPGGGGGGGGGQRGTLGTLGTGGGASIGILLLGTTTAEIVNNAIITGAGGNGGLGRAGGNGGTGGNGGSGGDHGCQFPLNTPCTGDGGDGGDGGTGGRGGHGGGGGGGPSIGIVEAVSASSVWTSNGFTLGTGGTGGTSSGNAGLAGETAQFKKLT